MQKQKEIIKDKIVTLREQKKRKTENIPLLAIEVFNHMEQEYINYYNLLEQVEKHIK